MLGTDAGRHPCLRAGRRPVLFDPDEVEGALREAAKRKEGHPANQHPSAD